jgi:hypothetical protein
MGKWKRATFARHGIVPPGGRLSRPAGAHETSTMPVMTEITMPLHLVPLFHAEADAACVHMALEQRATGVAVVEGGDPDLLP